MAMYYQSSSEIQADGLHTLYLMNPNYAAYSDSDTTPPNMLFLNPSSSAAAVTPHAPLHHGQQSMGIPLSHDPSRAALPQQQDIPIPRLHYNTWGSVDPNLPQQTPRGLSLSLAAHHQEGFDSEFPTGLGIMSPKKNCSPESNGVNSVIMGSKYLKAAQELLDEVVNVGKEAVKDKAKLVEERDKTAAIHIEAAIKAELTAAQRQEIQMKKSKLNSMLDEVEQRCRQYQQQMQIVVAAFEQAAGRGSGRAYTHLALKTISKQFRCLKSTISAQIKELSKRLGEEESFDHSNKLEGSRLKYVDAQIRQQMMQNNAWRPQRGLPERAVSVLRAWLFEHFLHPYPKDSDKQLLAKQTGLTRGQVSNWFINARVRLWKPMVEEMYLEETKNQPQIPDASIKPPTAAASPSEISASTLTTASPPGSSLPARTNFAQLITSLNMDSLQQQQQKNPKKPRNAINPSTDNIQMDEITEAGDHNFSTENYLSMAAANVNRYGADHHSQGNSFSLSLGLQPTESSQQQFFSHRGFEFGTRIESRVVEGGGGGGGVRINESGAASHHSNMGYEVLDFQNRKAFPAQLFPDFVA